MNMEDAKRISLSEILEILNRQPVKNKGDDVWYNSPFREEKTASFHINTKKNIWFDFGEAKGGDIIDLVAHYLFVHGEDYNGADVLRWLSKMQPVPKNTPKITNEDIDSNASPSLIVKRVSKLQSPMLFNYLGSRGITGEVAKRHIKEATVYNRNSGRYFLSLCLANECDGYELRSKFFKGCVAPKNISFIRGSKSIPTEIHVFEGIFDFLSLLEEQKVSRLEGDAIILNSVYCLPMAFPYIENYSYKNVHSWLDNDATGRNATLTLKDFVVSKAKLSFKSMNTMYFGHKDINAWHMYKRGLKPV